MATSIDNSKPMMPSDGQPLNDAPRPPEPISPAPVIMLSNEKLCAAHLAIGALTDKMGELTRWGPQPGVIRLQLLSEWQKVLGSYGPDGGITRAEAIGRKDALRRCIVIVVYVRGKGGDKPSWWIRLICPAFEAFRALTELMAEIES